MRIRRKNWCPDKPSGWKKNESLCFLFFFVNILQFCKCSGACARICRWNPVCRRRSHERRAARVLARDVRRWNDLVGAFLQGSRSFSPFRVFRESARRPAKRVRPEAGVRNHPRGPPLIKRSAGSVPASCSAPGRKASLAGTSHRQRAHPKRACACCSRCLPPPPL